MRFATAISALAAATALLVLSGLSGCAATEAPEAVPALSACSEPRPQVCTMIYAPVCALHEDGREETHASGCNACADDTVISHRDGACEEPAA